MPNDRLAPAVSDAQWAELFSAKLGAGTDEAFRSSLRISAERCAARDPLCAIALSNAALPNNDPYKITRSMVDAVAKAASGARLSEKQQATLQQLADALRAYLPPQDR